MKQTTQVDDFRSIIKNEFESRRVRRPTYSFRAFCRDLGIEASRLAAVMKGRYGLSAAVAKTISEKLHFSADQTNYFIDLVECKHARTALARLYSRSSPDLSHKIPV